MGRPPSDLDDYLDWQERLEKFRASGLSIEEFCLREGVSRSTYYRWVDQLDLLPREPDHWRMVEAVAAELLKKRFIDDARARELTGFTA